MGIESYRLTHYYLHCDQCDRTTPFDDLNRTQLIETARRSGWRVQQDEDGRVVRVLCPPHAGWATTEDSRATE